MNPQAAPQVEFQYHHWVVRVYRSSTRKRLAIEINEPGVIRARAPLRLSVARIQNFIHLQQDWITKAQLQLLNSPLPKNRGEAGEKWWFRGQHLELKDSLTVLKKPFLKIQGQNLICHWTENQFRNQPTPEQRLDLLKKETQKWCLVRLPERVSNWSHQMNLQQPRLKFRFARTRWGSCSSKGNLNFNIAIACTPDWVMDSIIIHELAHLVHLNHSKQFWALVQKFDKLESASSNWLRQHGHQILSQFGA